MVLKNYHRDCYLHRDKYMVRKADTLIAYWDLMPKGGTFYMMNKAPTDKLRFICNLFR